MNYKILDHTADLGLEAYGCSVREAFVHAAQGMFSIISPAERLSSEKFFFVDIEAGSIEELLVAWLNKLIYLYDTEKVLLGSFEITKLKEDRLEASVSGEPVNHSRHKIRTYIKAATHHHVLVKLHPPCTVRVLFDV